MRKSGYRIVVAGSLVLIAMVARHGVGARAAGAGAWHRPVR